MLNEWAKSALPEIFTKKVALELSLWQMIAVPAVVVVAYLASRMLSAVTTRVALRLSKLTTAKWDDILVERMASPARLFFTGVFGIVLFPLLDTHSTVLATLVTLMRMLMLVAGFWGLLRAVDIGYSSLRSSPWAAHRPAALPVFGLLSRVLKIAIFVLAVVTVLQQLGYPVAGILAGLGVGGLAVALAAQKTLENLLGSVMISIDQPLRVGDVVTVDGTTGTVEQIGLRSTQIRTFARTIVTIPNGKLADSKIENLAPRERIQLTFTVGLTYATTKAQLVAVIGDLKSLLAEHTHTYKDGCFVHMRELGESAIVLELNTWFELPEGVDFRDVRQAVLLDTLAIIEKHGAALAYPTRTILLDKSAGEAA